jgi:hypothetical protein
LQRVLVLSALSHETVVLVCLDPKALNPAHETHQRTSHRTSVLPHNITTKPEPRPSFLHRIPVGTCAGRRKCEET